MAIIKRRAEWNANPSHDKSGVKVDYVVSPRAESQAQACSLSENL